MTFQTFPAFRSPQLLLPRPGTDLRRWAVVACDQYTSEPEYWQQVADLVGDAPSTLHLTFPEVYLERPDAAARIAAIGRAMQKTLADGVLVPHNGPVLVERALHAGVRRGLMLEVDLEHYNFAADSTSLIRPTEGTIVARLAPRIEVRRSAPLELPHILVLIDDPRATVIEPLAHERKTLTPLYATELMLCGGHLAGYAVAPDAAERALQALAALARPEVFAPRYGVPAGTPPMLLAMGDGNHSLATAKAIWEQRKAEVGLHHPSRWALVEVVNIHDPALEFEPIHRVLFGVKVDVAATLQTALQASGARVQRERLPDGATLRERVTVIHEQAATERASERASERTDERAAEGSATQVFGLVAPGPVFELVTVSEPPSALVVGTVQPLLDALLADGRAAQIDYVHGDDVLERLGRERGNVGLLLPLLGKHELLNRVVHGGPLPRKTFSMGEAHEKRYYMESRRIR